MLTHTPLLPSSAGPSMQSLHTPQGFIGALAGQGGLAGSLIANGALGRQGSSMRLGAGVWRDGPSANGRAAMYAKRHISGEWPL